MKLLRYLAQLATVAMLPLLPVSVAAAAQAPAVIEIVDLSCPHCAIFAPVADRLARRVRNAGGIFRVAPIQPVVNGDHPVPAVLAVYWVQMHRGDKAAQNVADQLYVGFGNQASLSRAPGIASWLSVRGLKFKTPPDYGDPELMDHFRRAVLLAHSAGVNKLPALIFVNRQTAKIESVLSWAGSASRLVKQAGDALDRALPHQTSE